MESPDDNPASPIKPRCQGTTRSGERCKRTGAVYCRQHRDQTPTKPAPSATRHPSASGINSLAFAQLAAQSSAAAAFSKNLQKSLTPAFAELAKQTSAVAIFRQHLQENLTPAFTQLAKQASAGAMAGISDRASVGIGQVLLQVLQQNDQQLGAIARVTQANVSVLAKGMLTELGSGTALAKFTEGLKLPLPNYAAVFEPIQLGLGQTIAATFAQNTAFQSLMTTVARQFELNPAFKASSMEFAERFQMEWERTATEADVEVVETTEEAALDWLDQQLTRDEGTVTESELMERRVVFLISMAAVLFITINIPPFIMLGVLYSGWVTYSPLIRRAILETYGPLTEATRPE